MPIQIACPRCKEPLEVPDFAKGRAIQCPRCRSLAEVPDVSSSSFPLAQFLSPSDPMVVERILKRLYSQPLANCALFLGTCAILTFLTPRVSLMLGLTSIGTGLVGMKRIKESLGVSPPESDSDTIDPRHIAIKKINGGMAMAIVAVILAALLSQVI